MKNDPIANITEDQLKDSTEENAVEYYPKEDKGPARAAPAAKPAPVVSPAEVAAAKAKVLAEKGLVEDSDGRLRYDNGKLVGPPKPLTDNGGGWRGYDPNGFAGKAIKEMNRQAKAGGYDQMTATQLTQIAWNDALKRGQMKRNARSSAPTGSPSQAVIDERKQMEAAAAAKKGEIDRGVATRRAAFGDVASFAFNGLKNQFVDGKAVSDMYAIRKSKDGKHTYMTYTVSPEMTEELNRKFRAKGGKGDFGKVMAMVEIDTNGRPMKGFDPQLKVFYSPDGKPGTTNERDYRSFSVSGVEQMLNKAYKTLGYGDADALTYRTLGGYGTIGKAEFEKAQAEKAKNEAAIEHIRNADQLAADTLKETTRHNQATEKNAADAAAAKGKGGNGMQADDALKWVQYYDSQIEELKAAGNTMPDTERKQKIAALEQQKAVLMQQVQGGGGPVRIADQNAFAKLAEIWAKKNGWTKGTPPPAGGNGEGGNPPPPPAGGNGEGGNPPPPPAGGNGEGGNAGAKETGGNGGGKGGNESESVPAKVNAETKSGSLDMKDLAIKARRDILKYPGSNDEDKPRGWLMNKIMEGQEFNRVYDSLTDEERKEYWSLPKNKRREFMKAHGLMSEEEKKKTLKEAPAKKSGK